MLRPAVLGVSLSLFFMHARTLPLHGSRGMDSVTATGVLLCGGVPATRATVRLASADSEHAQTVYFRQ